jgi:hypothetical protein
MKLLIHQIFYDSKTEATLDPGFIPLNNTENQRPDWYELWVIKNFLERSTLIDDAWYGFFSPKLHAKTGLRANEIVDFLKTVDTNMEVVTIPYSWEQIAYFLNPFEQGNLFHPGLAKYTQQFIDHLGWDFNISTFAGHSGNSVFCNFIIAKPRYWKKWLELATAFFDLIESGKGDLAQALGGTTSYGSVRNQAPLKTFVQERFPSLILGKNEFQTSVLDISHQLPVFRRLFNEHPRTRRLLQTCDVLKSEYTRSGDIDLLLSYRKIRSLIPKNF